MPPYVNFLLEEIFKIELLENLEPFRTLAYVYREQLASLMRALRTTHAHFIRCILPNTQRHAFAMDGALVMQQLRFGIGERFRQSHLKFAKMVWASA